MIKLIIGNRGTGKTKILVDMMTRAVASTDGNVVCIDKGPKLAYSIRHSIRLVDAESYGIAGHEAFAGFILGVLAGNYDITEIYVDSLLKIVGRDYPALEKFFEIIDRATKDIKVVFTVSADPEELPESVRKLA